MTTIQTATLGSNAIELLARHGYHLARDSQEAGVRDVACWHDAAIFSLMAISTLTTNSALTYRVHITTGSTNPVIALPNPLSEWFDEDDVATTKFLTLMDSLMEQRPDLVTPLDEAQLTRIANLVANVKV
jgi:hypothetical protein